MKDRVKNAAIEAGLPFSDRAKIYNSRLAQELGKWAESNNRGDLFLHAAFKAYFADGINIAKIPDLMDIASSVGLPSNEAEEVLINRSYKTAVDEDWSLSHNKRITAVPSFIMNKERLVGAQPYEMLERLMESQGAKKRSA